MLYEVFKNFGNDIFSSSLTNEHLNFDFLILVIRSKKRIIENIFQNTIFIILRVKNINYLFICKWQLHFFLHIS